MDERKKIKILSSGPIECCGYIWGPVLTPYMELTSKIFKMISSGVHVVEVLEDGTEVKLTVENLKKDNAVTPEPTEEPEVIEEKPTMEDSVVEEVVEGPSIEPEESVEEATDVKLEAIEPEVTEEESTEEVVEEVKPVVTDEVNNRNNNRNKHRR